ncbi:MAG: HD domain-containing protein, partial [Thermoplasmata archaeon]|nr:HD domain-containing protein [Thermoplasmata archaeon]
MKYIRDPLYGDIKLMDEEFRLLNTFEMQRLTRIKQLGLKYLVYPGATHTRFEHSLGVRYLAELVLHRSGIFNAFSKEEKRIFFLAALLHDVSHPCFSHELEGLEFFHSHETMREHILKGGIKDSLVNLMIFTDEEIRKDRIRFIEDVLKEQTIEELLEFFSCKESVLYSLLDSDTIDVDKLDYLKRDPYYLGLPSANYDERIYSAFRITEDTGGNRVLSFSDDDTSLEAINSVLHARYCLYKIAYLHHTVLIADSMLFDAVKGFHMGRTGTMDLPFVTGDGEYLEYLKRGITIKRGDKYEEISSPPEVKSIINRLLSRNLYKRAFVLDNSDFYAKRRVVQMEKDRDFENDFIKLFDEEDKVMP